MNYGPRSLYSFYSRIELEHKEDGGETDILVSYLSSEVKDLGCGA
jgi:hypothetical protein